MKKCGLLTKGAAKVMAAVMAFSVVFSAGLTTEAATEGKEIFSGGENESYESNDASWLMNADDSDVIKIVYTCTDDTHAGWGILGWGATVDDVWKDGPGLSASETDATASVVAKVTAGDLKKTLGIKDGSNVSFIKLGAWNGGKIESLSISGAGAAGVDSSAPAEDSAAAEEVVISAPADLTGDYLYLVDSTETITIWPDQYLQYWVPGQTIHLKIEMESNGSFGGCLGTCVNRWAWQMEQFSSDTGSTITVDWFLTPIMNNIQLQFWWMSGSQIGIKSIEVVKAIHPNPPAEGEVIEPETPARDPYAGDPDAAYSGYMDVADSNWWTQTAISYEGLLGGVDPATVTSIVFNGEVPFQIGYNAATGSWTQHDNVTSYTAADMDLNADNYYAAIGFSKGDGVPYRFTWDVYTNGTAPGGDAEEETPDVPVETPDEETESNIKTDTYTFDVNENGNNEAFNFDLYNYFPNLQIGDQVKISADFTSDGGWYGGALGVTSTTAADGNWDSVNFSNDGASSVSLTATVMYDGSNGGNVTIWWIGGADATVNLTFEKLTN